ncbi:uncharacterized protein VTP21DRAFT_9 [Calcarisporiella thermophila]|uniref:uncharacterized protein n=1 Tax=Calcarisporiella thermophila TaxID=911321 RepID=UPI003744AD41
MGTPPSSVQSTSFTPFSENKDGGTSIGIPVGISVGAFLLLFAFIMGVLFIRKHRSSSQQQNQTEKVPPQVKPDDIETSEKPIYKPNEV